MNNKINQLYDLWLEKSNEDKDLIEELILVKDDYLKKEDMLYKDLSFGTGGLRGVIGAGNNRINIHTIRKATQGIANYIINNFPKDERRVAIAYDSRIKSNLFAKESARIFAANDIEVFIYKELVPTPCLSFAVRKLSCVSGVMITASHNPSKFNGYKVYGKDGCQITTKAADSIQGYINEIEIFNEINLLDFNEYVEVEKIKFIAENVYTAYIENVKKQSTIKDANISKDISIVYSPLNGAGLKPVIRTLSESGFNNIIIVKEQELPDGNFPTCLYPNPEDKNAMSLAIEYAKNNNADIAFATDPDCDRVGIAIKNEDGEYELISGNQVGVLLLDYIIKRKLETDTLPENPIAIKTIVTTDLAKKVADKYSVELIDVLTGFKFIGEKISLLESENEENRFIFGFEESYGYLSGTYVRDKDAVVASLLISEMFVYYKDKNINLCDKLNELCNEFGFTYNTLHSFEFDGIQGANKMENIMNSLRRDSSDLLGFKIIDKLDYINGINSLPKSDVIKFVLENEVSLVIRPSGTEPKLKIYVEIFAENEEIAKEKEIAIINQLKSKIIEEIE